MERLFYLFKRWTLLIFLLILMFVIFYFHLYELLTFKALSQYHAHIQQWTDTHYFLAVMGFMGIYIISVATSIPGATFLTVLGGYLFGVIATFYVVLSATFGATLLFLAIHTAIGNWLAKKAEGKMPQLEQELRSHAFHYLIVLRLIPIFPFWLVNIVPALLNIPLKTFVSATLIGIMPASFIYVMIGRGLGQVLSMGQTPDLTIIKTPSLLLPLIGLAVLAVLPIIYKRWKG